MKRPLEQLALAVTFFVPLSCGEKGTDPIAVATIELDAAAVDLELGDSVRLTATVRDAGGRPLAGRALTWTSSDAAVARVSAAGVITGVAAGNAMVTASAEGRSATAAVAVQPWNIAENVTVVDSLRLRLVSDSAERVAGRLRFQILQAPAPPFAAGSYVVGAQSGGFLRRVLSASVTGSTLTLETEAAALSDVIERGGFSTRIDLLFAPGAPPGALVGAAARGEVIWGEGEFTYLAPGVSVDGSGFDVSGTNICQLLAAATIGGVTCPSNVSKFNIKTGRLDFAPDFESEANWDGFSLEHFRLVATGVLDLDFVLELELSSSLPLLEPEATLFSFTRPFYWQVGAVPVVGYAELIGKIGLSLKATAKGGMEAGARSAGTVEVGAAWDEQGGWEGIADYGGGFNPVAPSVAEGTLKGTVQVEAKAALKPRLQFIFYGVIGPFAEMEPYAKAQLSLGSQSCSLTTSLGVNAAVGFTIPFLDKGVSDFSTSWKDPNPLFAGPSDTWNCPLGQLDVRTVTNGTDPDPDGYKLLLDGEDQGSIGVNATRLIQFVEKGTHTVKLDGVASNCVVDGGATREVTVATAGSTEVTFIIHCQPQGGDIVVSNATTGQAIDPDGYFVTLDNTSTQFLATNGSVTFAGVPAGSHTLSLSGVAPNCTVASSPLTVNVAAGGSVPAGFSVSCGGAQLVVRTQTSGTPATSTGWLIILDGGLQQSIAPNGQVTFATTQGSHSVQLSGVPGNCQVAGPNPNVVNVSGGSPTELVFSVTCQSAGITVGVTTTGDPAPVQNYTVVIGSQSQTVATTGTASFSSLAVGTHSVRLDGVPSHCTVQGLNPRNVDAPGSTSFVVICQSQAQCPAPPTDWFLRDTAYVFQPNAGGTDVPTVIRSAFGDAATSATSTGPAVGASGSAIAEVQWKDYLYLLPVDSARSGEWVDLHIRAVGNAEVSVSGTLATNASTKVELGSMALWLFNGSSAGTKSVPIDTVITRPMQLGSWDYQLNGRVESSTLGGYGATATANASIRIEQVLGAYDSQGKAIPILQVCTASGTVYPGT